MKKYAIIFFLTLCSFSLKGQDYETALGLRAGGFSGLTIKHFLNENNALEGLLHFWGYGFGITGLYEIHANAFNTTGLNWYYGAGAGIASWSSAGWLYNRYYNNTFALGIDGIIGIEYNIQEIPINIGIDFKPRLNLIGIFGLYPDGALSIRYTFD